MAANLYIHIMTDDITEDDLADFFAHTLSSKWFDMNRQGGRGKNWLDVCKKINGTPNVWVGEVSWLKAAVTGDPDTFVPGPVQAVHEIIGEDLPIIDNKLIKSLRKALKLDNRTSYDLSGSDKIIKFLKEHRGKRVFTVSW